MFILSAQDGGKYSVDKTALLQEREQFFPIDTSKHYKLNAGTVGVCKYPHFPLHFPPHSLTEPTLPVQIVSCTLRRG